MENKDKEEAKRLGSASTYFTRYLRKIVKRNTPDFTRQQRKTLYMLLTMSNNKETREEIISAIVQALQNEYPTANHRTLRRGVERVSNALETTEYEDVFVPSSKTVPMNYNFIDLEEDKQDEKLDSNEGLIAVNQEDELYTEEEEIARPLLHKKREKRGSYNKLPHARDFRPDWVDIATGTTYALAHNMSLVDVNRKTDPTAIVFFARTKGHTWPTVHSRVVFTDLETGGISGSGYVEQSLFERKRVMGLVVMRPLHWDQGSPFYVEQQK